MSDIAVKFLGKEYSFPEELKQYVVYCNEFEKISDTLSNALLVTMKRSSIIGDDHSQAGEVENGLKQTMRQEGKKLIPMLAKYNIFNVTESELVDNNKGYLMYEETYENMMNGLKNNLIEEMQAFLDGYEDAQRSAYSQVTGTGISMYSNSVIAHMTLAAFETSTVKKQCEKADRDFERAFDSMNARNASIREKKDVDVMMKTYASIAEAFGVYVTELMEIYLNKLQDNSVYDYSKLKPYSIKRSSELLNNLSVVDDKKSVLEQAFISCPYNPDIYAKVLELGLCDIDTFTTAKEFYQDSLLIGVVEDYCKKFLKDYDKVREPIAVLALYKGESETDILRSLFSSELDSVESKYRVLGTALTNQRTLDKWIRDNISQQTQSIINTATDNIRKKVHSTINGIISESNYRKFVSMGLLSADKLRLQDSAETELSGINEEIESKLISCINAYIEEAVIRKKKCDEAYAQFNEEVKKKNYAIAEKQNELNGLGLFAFSKKKEIKAIISDMEYALSKYENDNEPIDLLKAFERMYG